MVMRSENIHDVVKQDRGHDGKRQNEMTKKESSNGHRPAIDRHHKLNAQGP